MEILKLHGISEKIYFIAFLDKLCKISIRQRNNTTRNCTAHYLLFSTPYFDLKIDNAQYLIKYNGATERIRIILPQMVLFNDSDVGIGND